MGANALSSSACATDVALVAEEVAADMSRSADLKIVFVENQLPPANVKRIKTISSAAWKDGNDRAFVDGCAPPGRAGEEITAVQRHAKSLGEDVALNGEKDFAAVEMWTASSPTSERWLNAKAPSNLIPARMRAAGSKSP